LKSAPECLPCAVRQAMRTTRIAGLDGEAQKKAALAAMRVIVELDHGAAPAVIATAAIRAAEALFEGRDPFAGIKRETTAEALALYEEMRPEVEAELSSLDPIGRIRLCAKLAAAGNIIDFGISSDYDLKGTLEDTLSRDLAVDASGELHQAILGASEILVVGDNAGEIVFDRFLLDEITGMGKTAYLSVKSGPVLNDAVMSDALAAGIGEPVRLMETGSSSLGVALEECSPEFVRLFKRAGVVISKGQANYETLEDASRPVFSILRVKCPVISQPLGIPTGASVLMLGGSPR
jgi:uncharacterized protein with ATP-grasp and redox domains